MAEAMKTQKTCPLCNGKVVEAEESIHFYHTKDCPVVRYWEWLPKVAALVRANKALVKALEVSKPLWDMPIWNHLLFEADLRRCVDCGRLNNQRHTGPCRAQYLPAFADLARVALAMNKERIEDGKPNTS